MTVKVKERNMNTEEGNFKGMSEGKIKSMMHEASERQAHLT